MSSQKRERMLKQVSVWECVNTSTHSQKRELDVPGRINR
jgi:hypothetical protein